MKRLGQVASQATELGLVMGLTAAGCVLVGLLLGRWIDARLGTAPYGSLLLLVAGLVAGQAALVHLALRARERLDADAGRPLSGGIAWGALKLAGLALALTALPGAAGLALGLALDRALHSAPWLMLILTLGGLVGGLIGCVRLVRRRPTGGAA